MTRENKDFFKKNWQIVVGVVLTQFTLTFLGNFSSQKLFEYRLEKVENRIEQVDNKIQNHIDKFDNEYKEKLGILFWLHNLTGNSKNNANNDHKHKEET